MCLCLPLQVPAGRAQAASCLSASHPQPVPRALQPGRFPHSQPHTDFGHPRKDNLRSHALKQTGSARLRDRGALCFSWKSANPDCPARLICKTKLTCSRNICQFLKSYLLFVFVVLYLTTITRGSARACVCV